MKKIMLAMGTRPEVIKMESVYHELRKDDLLVPIVCMTGQHTELTRPLVDLFDLKVDFSLDLMEKNQGLSSLASRVLQSMPAALREASPDAVLVQGDTTTAFAVALAAFHEGIPVGHVEAGLRTGRLDSPFPEEANRSMLSRIAKWHFAPTRLAAENLAKENITSNVHVTGNTVVDALLRMRNRIECQEVAVEPHGFEGNNHVLITTHRRESFGRPMVSICGAIADLADRFPDFAFVLPVHPNPNLREPIEHALANKPNVHLIDPLPYQDFVALMMSCRLILTDSGGIQEEAPSLGKPVVVMRDVTERKEALETKSIVLAGTERQSIRQAAEDLLNDHQSIPNDNPFGDGSSSIKITQTLSSELQSP
jgi:UDP-N-acetylglucosamine 2-epimerase (non-hydrolysing)